MPKALPCRDKEMKFSIYAVEDKAVPHHFVPADLFTRKVRAVINALKKADKVANAVRPHSYFVSHLKTGSAEVGIVEHTIKPDSMFRSSVDTFTNCATALNRGDFERASLYDGLPSAIHAIAKDAGQQFSHITLMPQEVEPIRVDDFFEAQVTRFLNRPQEESPKPPPHFRGTAHDAFDGFLKEVDLRGEVWRGKLVLAGGNKKEIDCILRGWTIERVREHLDMRVWAEGLAIYHEQSGLPQRLEISRMTPIKAGRDLRRWRGKLTSGDDRGEDELDVFEQ